MRPLTLQEFWVLTEIKNGRILGQHLQHAQRESAMPEVSSRNASKIIGVSDQTVRRHIHASRLLARREGLDRTWWIDMDALREFARVYNYRFNEDLAKDLARHFN